MHAAWANPPVSVCRVENEFFGFGFPWKSFIFQLCTNLPVLATSQGSTIVSPVMNLNVSERDMNMGSFLDNMLWADAAKDKMDRGDRF